MSVTKIMTVDFGTRYTGIPVGLSGVGYALLNTDGSTKLARTTVGVFNVHPSSGMYAVNITFDDLWNGLVVWDSGPLIDPVAYATDEYHDTLEFIRDMTAGRWKVDSLTNQMVFYKEDNTTPIATFNLLDENSLPTVDAPVERQKV